MRYILLFILSINAHAGFILKDKASTCGGSKFYRSKAECQTSGECIEVDHNYNCMTHEWKEEQILKADVIPCTDEQDCDSKFLSHQCSDSEYHSIKNYDLLQVYCIKVIAAGVKEDPVKKASFEAQEQLRKIEESEIRAALRAMSCGKEVMAIMSIKNSKKGLSKGQVKQIVNTYSEIKALLETGSLVTAKDEIAAIIPDGILVTNDDKDALINKINSCL